MDAIQVTDYASRLVSAHGAKAILEVSEKMRECEARGKLDEARDWARVRETIHRMRGPRQK
ncbi:hypothetical protein [Marinovum sp.]|uniref:hypothetical protein n=1 Tax=Marinovum sp. TaxID=2024839 RepID=UPI003A90FFB5